MAVVAIAGDDLVALFERHLHADDDGFLADIEVAETADEAHAVELAGLFLEAADEQHLAIGGELLLLGEFERRLGRARFVLAGVTFQGVASVLFGFCGRHEPLRLIPPTLCQL